MKSINSLDFRSNLSSLLLSHTHTHVRKHTAECLILKSAENAQIWPSGHICNTVPPIADSTFFSIVHGTFTKLAINGVTKISQNKFQYIKTIWSMFSEHSGIKLEVTKRLLENA